MKDEHPAPPWVGGLFDPFHPYGCPVSAVDCTVSATPRYAAPLHSAAAPTLGPYSRVEAVLHGAILYANNGGSINHNPTSIQARSLYSAVPANMCKTLVMTMVRSYLMLAEVLRQYTAAAVWCLGEKI